MPNGKRKNYGGTTVMLRTALRRSFHSDRSERHAVTVEAPPTPPLHMGKPAVDLPVGPVSRSIGLGSYPASPCVPRRMPRRCAGPGR
jgi:hypothetical protein